MLQYVKLAGDPAKGGLIAVIWHAVCMPYALSYHVHCCIIYIAELSNDGE